MLHGQHLIAGTWVGSGERFENLPVSGEADSFAVGTLELVGEAVDAAEEAFASYSATSICERAVFLRMIADEIDARGDAITAMCRFASKCGYSVGGAHRDHSSHIAARY
ncbi:MAG: hypothetical protein ACE37E_02490 [Hyphomicrobiales bacterium]